MSEPLSKGSIEQATDRVLERVEVVEWGGYAFIREMDDAEREAWETYLLSRAEAGETGPGGIRRRLVALCLVDDSGTHLFDPLSADTVLRKKNARVVNRLFEIAARVNGLDAEAKERARKNSSGTPGSASASA